MSKKEPMDKKLEEQLKHVFNDSNDTTNEDAGDSNTEIPADNADSDKNADKDANNCGEKVQDMGEKLAEINDKYLRLYSEYENYRKSTNLEKADLLINGSRDTIKAILPVIDDFERALAATQDEGVQLIYNKLMKILEQKGLKAMEAKGEKFDESLHEAITRIPSAEGQEKGIVADVVEKGYFLNDKVLRYAKVVVTF